MIDVISIVPQGITLAISMVGIRGPSAVGGVSSDVPIPFVPGLPGLITPPNGIPPLKVSNVSRIRFGGNNSVLDWILRFSPSLSSVGNAPPQNQLTVGSPGGWCVQAATGYTPGMQIKLYKNGASGVSYTRDVTWVSDGVVGFRIPQQCSTGNHSVRKCRHFLGEVNGQPLYGPWLTIPQGQRAVITVQ